MEPFYKQNELITQINLYISKFEYENAIETLAILKNDFPRNWIKQLKMREFLVRKTTNNHYNDFIKKVSVIDSFGKKFSQFISEVEIINSTYVNKDLADSESIFNSKNIVRSYFASLPYIILDAIKKSKNNPHILNYNMTQMFRLFHLIFDTHDLTEKSNYKQILNNNFISRKVISRYFSYLQMIAIWSNFEVVYDYWRKDTYSFSLSRHNQINGKVINHHKIEKLIFNELDTVFSASDRAIFFRLNKSKKHKNISERLK